MTNFISEGRPNPDTKEEILTALINAAEDSFDRELQDSEAAIIRSHYEPVADYLATQQEAIGEVLSSGQIDYAEGAALDLLTALIGVPRREAMAATVRERFIRDSRTPKDYSIPEGTEVQIDSATPVKFQTTSPTELSYYDGFEDNSLSEYSNDTSVFTTQGTTVYDGSYALEGTASAGLIVNDDERIAHGSKTHFRYYSQAGAQSAFAFGIQDVSNYFRLYIDEPNSVARIELVENGSSSIVGSGATVSVPNSEWLDVTIDWKQQGDIQFIIDDASGTNLVDKTVTDPDVTYTTGKFGFEGIDTSTSKFWDHVHQSETSALARATEKGARTNVSADTIVVLSSDVAGIDSVTNPLAADDGRDRESDDELRERAKRELSEGSRSSQPALISALRGLPETRSVTVIVNDSSSQDADGRDSHTFEAVVDVDPDDYEKVARTILDTKAAGDVPVAGFEGSSVTKTLEMVNGQEKDISFTTPSDVKIYVDCDVTVTDSYSGNNAIRDSIVQYIGGVLTSGANAAGRLGVGDDVIYNQVVEAVMDVEGVYDVTNLEVDTSSSPTGTSNISISSGSQATADGSDASLSVSSTHK